MHTRCTLRRACVIILWWVLTAVYPDGRATPSLATWNPVGPVDVRARLRIGRELNKRRTGQSQIVLSMRGGGTPPPANCSQHAELAQCTSNCGVAKQRCRHQRATGTCKLCTKEQERVMCKNKRSCTQEEKLHTSTYWQDRSKEFSTPSVCDHSCVRAQCRESGGSTEPSSPLERLNSSSQQRLCKHLRERSKCFPCGGTQMCEHGRRRHRCKECGGPSICMHKRERSSCKPCRGSQICEHNRRRTICKACGGGSFCQHGREKYKCSVCKTT